MRPFDDADLRELLDGTLSPERRSELAEDSAAATEIARLDAVRAAIRDEAPIPVVGRGETVERLRRSRPPLIGVPRWVWFAGTGAVVGLSLLTAPRPAVPKWGYIYASSPPLSAPAVRSERAVAPMQAQTEESVAWTGSLVLRTPEAIRAAARAEEAAVRLGGASVETVVREGRDPTGRATESAMLLLKVPRSELESLTAEVRRLGRVVSESSAAEDLRAERTTATERREGLRSRERELLSAPDSSPADRASAEAGAERRAETGVSLADRLRKTRRDLSSLDQGDRALRDRIAFSTLRVSLAP